MATLTEMVATLDVHSSTVAFSHFGVALDAPRLEQSTAPVVEQRVVALTPRRTGNQVGGADVRAPDTKQKRKTTSTQA